MPAKKKKAAKARKKKQRPAVTVKETRNGAGVVMEEANGKKNQ